MLEWIVDGSNRKTLLNKISWGKHVDDFCHMADIGGQNGSEYTNRLDRGRSIGYNSYAWQNSVRRRLNSNEAAPTGLEDLTNLIPKKENQVAPSIGLMWPWDRDDE